MFDQTSRYVNSHIAKLTTETGRIINYIERRLLPSQVDEKTTYLQEMTVNAGDRLDMIATRTIGDPLQYWRICDVNDCMYPLELTSEPGRQIRIPAPGLTKRI